MRKFINNFVIVLILFSFISSFLPSNIKAIDSPVYDSLHPTPEWYHLTLWIGSVFMKTEEKDKPFVILDTVPIFVDSRSYVPLRTVLENLVTPEEAKTVVTWDAKLRKATFTRRTHIIEVYVGEDYILNNGSKLYLETPAFINNGRIMMPFRAITEGLGAIVFWDAALKKIDIYALKAFL